MHGRVLSTLLDGFPASLADQETQRCFDLSQTILEFVERHGLTVCWLHRMRNLHPKVGAFGESEALAVLSRREREALALYLAQSRTIQQLTQSFDQAGIRHALIKGTAWRDEIYDLPYARTATDIDLLVDETGLSTCRQRLADLGFACVTQGSRGHEETWVRGSVDIDLHWQILAPGRMPEAIVGDVLGRRVRTPGGFWRLCNEDMVAILLMHLAVSKYVCSRHAGLNRILDLLLATRRLPIDWQRVAEAGYRARLSGAVWATVCWVNRMAAAVSAPFASCFPPQFSLAVRPGPWRARYLMYWVSGDLPGMLEPRVAWFVRYAFTLPMHDTLRAACVAVLTRLRVRSP